MAVLAGADGCTAVNGRIRHDLALTDLFSPGPPSSSSHSSHTCTFSPECFSSEKNASASSCGVLGVLGPGVVSSALDPLAVLGILSPVGTALESESEMVMVVGPKMV